MKTIILVIIVFVFISGCNKYDPKLEIYENESKIAEQGDSYSFSNRIGAVSNSEGKIEFSEFNGMETLLFISTNEEGV